MPQLERRHIEPGDRTPHRITDEDIVRSHIAAFFEVTLPNHRQLHQQRKYEEELRHNGYEVLLGKRLKELKIAIMEQFGDEMNFIAKTTVLGIFDFRAFLNIAIMRVFLQLRTISSSQTQLARTSRNLEIRLYDGE